MTHQPRLIKAKATGIVKNQSGVTRTSGFTMTEILVTVAIIGIVAALALPTISRMSEGAKNGKCISNLKSTGTAILLHAQENSGRMVLPWASASASDVANFPQLKDHPQAGQTWFNYLNSLGYVEDLRSTICPSFPPLYVQKSDRQSDDDDLWNAAGECHSLRPGSDSECGKTQHLRTPRR